MATNNQRRERLAALLDAEFTNQGISVPTVLSYRTGFIDELPSPIVMVTERSIPPTQGEQGKRLYLSVVMLVRFRNAAEDAQAETVMSTIAEAVTDYIASDDIQLQERTYWKGIQTQSNTVFQYIGYAGQYYRQAHAILNVRTQ